MATPSIVLWVAARTPPLSYWDGCAASPFLPLGVATRQFFLLLNNKFASIPKKNKHVFSQNIPIRRCVKLSKKCFCVLFIESALHCIFFFFFAKCFVW
jgi:hypothetical protein